ncbi:Glucose N-acetyltransferase-like protein 2 [Elsinoe fawcettii]|nr:Glucose N-acetyltransferase-like protein 2 [Elsinoe fawcettii]
MDEEAGMPLRWASPSRSRLLRWVPLVIISLVFIHITYSYSHEWRIHQPLEGAHPMKEASSIPAHQDATDQQMKSDYAYSLYITDVNYLCPAVMMLDSLQSVGSRASRLLLHPESWEDEDLRDPHVDTLLTKALNLGATLRPVQIQTSPEGDPTWRDSYTKLLSFNQTEFKRVLSLDTDATVLRNLDDLFFREVGTVAAPLAYWMKDRTLSSQMLLVKPSKQEFSKIMDQIQHHKKGDFDMEIVNNLYGDTATILPHRPYDLLTGEFKAKDHSAYLGDRERVWDATAELANAKFVHFSDWPMPKPWFAVPADVEKRMLPCVPSADGGPEDCSDRDAWAWLYHDYLDRKARTPISIPSFTPLSHPLNPLPSQTKMSDSIDRVFGHALNTINKIRLTSSKPPVADRLHLYGLYKQAMEGNVTDVTPRPAGTSDTSRKEAEKWDAWHANTGLTRTEAKKRYIEHLIKTMHSYASGTEEARELVGELEFVWDQVKNNSPGQSGSEGSRGGYLGIPTGGREGMRTVEPEEEEEEEEREEFVDAPVSQFEGEEGEKEERTRKRGTVGDVKWRRRVEGAIVKMTTEVAALRELVESRRYTAQRRRGGIVSWILGLGWFLVKLVVADVFVLWLVLLYLRRKKDRRLEGAIRVMLGDAQAVAKNLATTVQNKLPSRK